MYNYYDAMYDDIKTAILCSFWDELREAVIDSGAETGAEVADAIKETLWDDVYDDLFIYDRVTGNASGSYWFKAHAAEEALAGNWDLIAEAAAAFGGDAGEWFARGAEYCDVAVRCWMLGQVLGEVLNDIADAVEALDTDSTDAGEVLEMVKAAV